MSFEHITQTGKTTLLKFQDIYSNCLDVQIFQIFLVFFVSALKEKKQKKNAPVLVVMTGQ